MNTEDGTFAAEKPDNVLAAVRMLTKHSYQSRFVAWFGLVANWLMCLLAYFLTEQIDSMTAILDEPSLDVLMQRTLILLLATTVAGTLRVVWVQANGYRFTIHRLNDSDLVERATSGQLQLDNLHDAVPRIIRFFWKTTSKPTLKHRLAVVANNLSWFLKPQRPYIMAELIPPILYVFLLVGVLASGHMAYMLIAILLAPLVLPLMLTSFAWRASYNSALASTLKERLEA